MRAKRHRGIGVWVIGLVLALSAGCGEPKITEVPDELIGVWTTTAIDYRDRFLEIRKDAVLFDTGEGTPSANPVIEVTQEMADDRHAYTIVCFDSEGSGEYKLHLLYDSSLQVLRLKNRPQVPWIRSRAARLPEILSRAQFSEAQSVG